MAPCSHGLDGLCTKAGCLGSTVCLGMEWCCRGESGLMVVLAKRALSHAANGLERVILFFP